MKRLAVCAVLGTLLVSTAPRPAEAQTAAAAAEIATSVGKAIGGAILKEGIRIVIGDIFGTGPDPVTPDQIQSIISSAFDNYTLQQIDAQQDAVAQTVGIYTPQTADDNAAYRVMDRAITLISAVNGSINGDNAVHLLPAFVSAQTAKLAFQAERARLDTTDVSGETRVSSDHDQPTQSAFLVASLAYDGLDRLERYLTTDFTDHHNADQGCLYKDHDTQWVVNGETVYNDWTSEGRDPSQVYCRVFDYGYLFPTSIPVNLRDHSIAQYQNSNKRWLFRSTLTETTSIVHQAVIGQYQFAVREVNNGNDYFLLWDTNEDAANMRKNFHTLTKNTDTLGNLQDVALAWLDVALAYQQRFGPNIPQGGIKSGDALALQALQEATYLGVDQWELLQRGKDVPGFVTWFHGKLSEWRAANASYFHLYVHPDNPVVNRDRDCVSRRTGEDTFLRCRLDVDLHTLQVMSGE